MRKTFSLRTFVMFFMTISLVASVMTGCKDYDDDIDDLQKQITALKADVSNEFNTKMDAKISALEKRISTATKKELVNLLVTKETFEQFKKDVNAKLKNATSADGLKAVETKVNSNEGRLAALEALLKVKDDKSDVLADLQKKVAANEAAIQKMLKGGIDKEAFKKMMKDMGINIADFSGKLASLVFFPESYINGVEAIVFRPVVFNQKEVKVIPQDECNPVTPAKPTCLDKVGQEIKFVANGKTSTFQMLSAATEVSYQMNPSGVDASKIDKENLMVTSHVAKMYTKSGGVEDAIEGNPFTAKYVSMKDGKLKVSLDIDYAKFAEAYANDFDLGEYMRGNVGNGSESANGAKNIVLALQVPHAKGEKAEGSPFVTSDYTVAVVKPVWGIDIAKKTGDCLRYSDYIDPAGSKENMPKGTKDWANVDNAKEMGDGINMYEGDKTVKPEDPRIVKLVEGEKLDLHKVVKAVSGSERFPKKADCSNVDINKYGFEWKFDLKDQAGKTIKYTLTKNNTDQQKFIKLDEKTGVVEARVYTQAAQGAAVDRTPIVRVRIIDPNNPDCFISQAFIKILIVKEKEQPVEEQTIVFPQQNYVVKCNKTDMHKQMLTVQQVNELIYNKYGMSKEDFHKKYPNFKHVEGVGTVSLKDDIKDGQTTYLPMWEVSACDMYAFADKCGKEAASRVFTAKGKFYNDKGEEIFVVFSVKVTKPEAMNLVPADMYKKYWNDDYRYVEHHSQKPRTVNDTDVNNFIYESDLNAAFVNTAITPTKFKNMDYEYVFAPANEQISGAKDADGKAIKITVDNNDPNEKKLFANGILVAKIKNHTTVNKDVVTTKDMLVYEKNDMANYLLNKSVEGQNYFMWAKIQIRAKCDCPKAKENFITVNGRDGFKVRFLRPIDVNSVSPEHYIDGVDLGKKGSILDIYKVVGLTDWRKDKFSENENYYKFYNIKGIKYDPKNGKARWDANGKIEAIPPTVDLKWIDKAEVEAKTGKTYTGADFKDGGLLYDSNDTTVKEDYYLYVPITIEYERGLIITREVKIKVVATTTKSGK